MKETIDALARHNDPEQLLLSEVKLDRTQFEIFLCCERSPFQLVPPKKKLIFLCVLLYFQLSTTPTPMYIPQIESSLDFFFAWCFQLNENRARKVNENENNSVYMLYSTAQ